jgi:hypothetical protein
MAQGTREYERLLRAGIPEREAREVAGLPCFDPTEEDLQQMALNRSMADGLKVVRSPRDRRKAINQQITLRRRFLGALARAVLSVLEVSKRKARLTSSSNQFASASRVERARAISEFAATYWLDSSSETQLSRMAVAATSELDIVELVVELDRAAQPPPDRSPD